MVEQNFISSYDLSLRDNFQLKMLTQNMMSSHAINITFTGGLYRKDHTPGMLTTASRLIICRWNLLS
ncbi:hypothetical protein Pfo_023420 [Paulownia fortunei]|nr:hypothetical protein Pfo_023420 [Paulownia fortunei]